MMGAVTSFVLVRHHQGTSGHGDLHYTPAFPGHLSGLHGHITGGKIHKVVRELL